LGGIDDFANVTLVRIHKIINTKVNEYDKQISAELIAVINDFRAKLQTVYDDISERVGKANRVWGMVDHLNGTLITQRDELKAKLDDVVEKLDESRAEVNRLCTNHMAKVEAFNAGCKSARTGGNEFSCPSDRNNDDWLFGFAWGKRKGVKKIAAERDELKAKLDAVLEVVKLDREPEETTLHYGVNYDT